jgi:hypothetical protein
MNGKGSVLVAQLPAEYLIYYTTFIAGITETQCLVRRLCFHHTEPTLSSLCDGAGIKKRE